MAGKFEKQASLIMEDVYGLYNRSLRLALSAAVRAAINATVHDSSNAGHHWLLADSRYSRPAARSEGTVRDLRGRKGSDRSSPREGKGTVGFKGGGGRHRYATEIAVGQRERAVSDKYVKGRDPARKFYLYHGLADGKSQFSPEGTAKYAERAGIEEAGKAGLRAFDEAMERYFQAGRVRKQR